MHDWNEELPASVDPEVLLKQHPADPAVAAYLEDIRKCRPLLPEEAETLIRLAAEDDREAKEKLTEANLGLAAAIALTYQDQGLCSLDLIQEGNIGLLRAIDTFHPEAGMPFATYAAACIHHEIRRGLEVVDRHASVEALRQMERVHAYIRDMRFDLGREPTEAEIARALGRSRESRRDALPVYEEPDESIREAAAEVLDQLTPREAAVLRMRFGLEDGHTRTLEEVARAFGVTRERIRQIENKAIRRHVRLKRRRSIQEFDD